MVTHEPSTSSWTRFLFHPSSSSLHAVKEGAASHRPDWKLPFLVHRVSMPRRVRTIFLVLILLALALLATHITLTWSPAQPLVFRVVEQYIDPAAGPPARIIVLEMENRSPVSIYLASGYLISGLGEKGGSDVQEVIRRGVYLPEVHPHDPEIFPVLGTFQWATSSTHPHLLGGGPKPRLIRPGETVRLEAYVSAKSLAVARQDDVYAVYSWISTTRYWFHQIQHRLYVFAGKRSPFDAPFMDLLRPSMTPLQMPATVLPAPEKP